MPTKENPLESLPVTSSEIRRLYDSGLTVREISAVLSAGAIPPQTIWKIAETGKVPKKWRAYIVPDGVIASRKRRARLDEIARQAGYTSWANYETETIKKGKIK